jgi:hypothetical protein
LKRIKKEDEISAHPAISPSTIPLTSGIEEAPQLLLSVDYIFTTLRSPRASRWWASLSLIIEPRQNLWYKGL